MKKLLLFTIILFVSTPVFATNKSSFQINFSDKSTVNLVATPENDPESLFQATMALKSGDLYKALDLCNEALNKQPDNPRIYNLRGNIKAGMNDIQGAFEDYTMSILIQTDYPTPYYNRANLYRDIGEYSKSISDYNTAIALGENLKIASYINRGFVKLSFMNDIDGALDDFTEAINLGATDEGPYYGSAVCYYNKQMYNKTINYTVKAITLSPKNPDAYAIQGQAKIKLNRIDEGLQDLKYAENQYKSDGNINKANEMNTLYQYYFNFYY